MVYAAKIPLRDLLYPELMLEVFLSYTTFQSTFIVRKLFRVLPKP